MTSHAQSGTGNAAAPVLSVGSRLEPLMDRSLIDRLSGGAALVLQKPIPREIAIIHDKPWEGNVSTYHTVFRDGDRYRMYYRGAHVDEATRKSAHAEVVCYAESTDGIHWNKPNLGLFEFAGSRDNNIVWTDTIGAHDFAPFKDENPACPPDARYKAFGMGKNPATGRDALFAFRSADALHWSRMSEQPIQTDGAFDSLNIGFWDTYRQRYVEYHRKYRKGSKGGVRDILFSTSSDFATWTKPAFLDYERPPDDVQLYTSAITPYYRAPHFFVGFPKRIVLDRNPARHFQPGVSDGLFMSSRDGKRFHRWDEAFLRPGVKPSRWVNRNNLIAWGIVETASEETGASPEISLYATEDYYTGDSCKLRRYTVRLDGFTSVHAPAIGGEMRTPPLRFAGNELVLNMATSAAGSIRVEIQDPAGKPIPGYTLSECPEIYGDSVAVVVRWKNGSDLKKLADAPVRLRFVMEDADLYSLQFRAEEEK
jgi:hypothetical protein